MSHNALECPGKHHNYVVVHPIGAETEPASSLGGQCRPEVEQTALACLRAEGLEVFQTLFLRADTTSESLSVVAAVGSTFV